MFKYAPEIKIGDVFTRTDKNGNIWKAEVINRTEYFVDVKKTQPYQVRVCDEEPFRQKRFYNGAWHFKDVGGVFHYEDAEPTFERAQINIEYEEYETGKIIKGLFGDYPEKAKRPTGKFFIAIKEEYSKSNQYDKIYSIRKNNKDDNWENFQKSSIITFSNNKVNYEISSNYKVEINVFKIYENKTVEYLQSFKYSENGLEEALTYVKNKIEEV